MEYWMDYSRIYTTNMTLFNSDNGDLLQLVMDLVDPGGLGQECLALRGKAEEEYYPYIYCFVKLLPQLLALPSDYPIKFMWPMTGFWRVNEINAVASECPIWKYGWTNDFLIGGRKKGEPEWHTVVARGEESLISSVLQPHNTEQRQLEAAKSCCFWHYPGCSTDSGNICRQEAHCQTSLAGRVGLGLLYVEDPYHPDGVCNYVC